MGRRPLFMDHILCVDASGRASPIGSSRRARESRRRFCLAQSRRAAERLGVSPTIAATQMWFGRPAPMRTVCIAPACASEPTSLRLCGSARGLQRRCVPPIGSSRGRGSRGVAFVSRRAAEPQRGWGCRRRSPRRRCGLGVPLRCERSASPRPAHLSRPLCASAALREVFSGAAYRRSARREGGVGRGVAFVSRQAAEPQRGWGCRRRSPRAGRCAAARCAAGSRRPRSWAARLAPPPENPPIEPSGISGELPRAAPRVRAG